MRFFVLDEADRLLEPSFESELRIIAGALPAQRQTLLFSATLTRSLAMLQASSLRDAHIFQVSDEGQRQLLWHYCERLGAMAVYSLNQVHAWQAYAARYPGYTAMSVAMRTGSDAGALQDLAGCCESGVVPAGILKLWHPRAGI